MSPAPALSPPPKHPAAPIPVASTAIGRGGMAFDRARSLSPATVDFERAQLWKHSGNEMGTHVTGPALQRRTTIPGGFAGGTVARPVPAGPDRRGRAVAGTGRGAGQRGHRRAGEVTVDDLVMLG